MRKCRHFRRKVMPTVSVQVISNPSRRAAVPGKKSAVRATRMAEVATEESSCPRLRCRESRCKSSPRFADVTGGRSRVRRCDHGNEASPLSDRSAAATKARTRTWSADLENEESGLSLVENPGGR
jgi:hypothetical protein